MRILNKLVYACCSIAFGLMALPSCEGGELYDVNAPDWISEKVDSIANSKKDPEEEVLEGIAQGDIDHALVITALSRVFDLRPPGLARQDP